MTETLTRAGKSIFFPSSFAVDEEGVIIPPSLESLPAIAFAVAPHELGLFAKRLVDAARKRRFQARYTAVNRRRLQLAALCIERWLDEEFDAEFERLDRNHSIPMQFAEAS